MQNDLFKAGLEYSFVYKTEEIYHDRSKILVNDARRGLKVLNALRFELSRCDSFFWIVAFATAGGVQSVMAQLADLERRNVRGKILLSTYQTFTQPAALHKLRQFQNLEIRLLREELDNAHWKGYVFEHNASYAAIIGSSNLTASALSVNRELNVELHMKESSSLYQEIRFEFDTDWARADVLDDDFLAAYQVAYEAKKAIRVKEARDKIAYRVEPNSMQKEALDRLKQVRAEGHKRALVVSATGTGKTFLAAFDVKAFKAKKFLFVVHRENIANRARETFEIVHGLDVKMGVYTGGKFDSDADFIFATVQTLSRDRHLQQFAQDHFDYIVFDEAHRIGASSHLKVLNYFKPEFVLGMTATPERSDGFNVFAEFNHVIAYEIRLNQALESQILSNFHYFGIAGIEVEGYGTVDGFNELEHENRVQHILENVERYGADGIRIRGIIFCSRQAEAIALSASLNARGVRTKALTGKDSEMAREEAIQRLESDGLDALDYILVVDIFNEGIDIPKINQIIMLRPTESVIVFVQQLGRGLRKSPGKEFLTVIDFIGNHNNNFMIPLALYGDNRYDKEGIRRNLLRENLHVPGASTVSFDRISKERILEAVNRANLSSNKLLVEDFQLLSHELGRPPHMMDFVRMNKRYPTTYFVNEDGKPLAYKSYLEVLKKLAPALVGVVSDEEFELARILVKTLCFKRATEYYVLQMALSSRTWFSRAELKEYLTSKGCDKSLDSALDNLLLRFDPSVTNYKENYADFSVIECSGELVRIKPGFSEVYYQHLTDLSSAVLAILEMENLLGDELVLYKKYTRRDAMALLQFETMMIEQSIGGYRCDSDRPVMAIFMKTHKTEDWTHIVDRFTSPSTLDYSSKPGQKLGGAVHTWIRDNEFGDFHLFVAKDSAEGTGFYYMGKMKPHLDQFTNAPHEGKNFVRMHFTLHHPAEEKMYEYLTS